jgi:hypothetical protein
LKWILVSERTWPVVSFQPAPLPILAQANSDVETSSPRSTAFVYSLEQSTGSPTATAANIADVDVPNALLIDPVPDQVEELVTSHVATGGSDEEFSIKVERFEEIGADYVWTLRLKGFEKNQSIYIYDKGKQLKGSGGCKIVDLDAQEVRVKASLFDLREQVNYTFRLVKFHVFILLLYCLYSTYIYTYIYRM